MQTCITVLGGDLRQKYLSLRLRAAGFQVHTFRVPELPDTPISLPGALSQSQALALPMPALDAQLQIRAEPDPVPLDAILPHLLPGCVVFGGPLDRVSEILSRQPLVVSDYTKSGAVAAANAVPTAEGSIQIAMERLPITLSGSRCLVVGFGRIGKVLCGRLHGLHACVTAAARDPADRALAEALGFSSDETGRYARGLAQYDCIFNTVPSCIFSEDQLAAMRPDCLLIDLASAPGGLPKCAASLPSPVCITAPGLPGKTSPASAASILCKHICRTLSEH